MNNHNKYKNFQGKYDDISLEKKAIEIIKLKIEKEIELEKFKSVHIDAKSIMR